MFERDRATPRAATAVVALCVAVDLMRTYKAELMESESDRLKIPPEVTRLEALATTAAAPCAPAPAPAPPPQPPLVAVETPTPVLEGPASPPPLVSPPAHAAAFQAGLGTLLPGLLLFAPVVGLLAYRGEGERQLAALFVDLKDRPVTPDDIDEAAALGRRYTATTAGAVALGSRARCSS